MMSNQVSSGRIIVDRSADCQHFRRPAHSQLLAGLLLAILLIPSGGCKRTAAPRHTFQVPLGSQIGEIEIVSANAQAASNGADFAAAELHRIIRRFDPLNPNGPLYQLNISRRTDDPELYSLLRRCWDVSEYTGGAYSFFLGLVEQAYGFGSSFPKPPEPEQIKALLLPLRRVKIEFSADEMAVSIPNDAYVISLTGILTGYLVDQGLALINQAGLSSAKVQIDNIVAFSSSPDGIGWPVDVLHPNNQQVIATLLIEDAAVAIAARSDQAYQYRNRPYYNHIDPETGLPADKVLVVAVIAPSAELAAALARGIFIMEPDSGIGLLNVFPEVEGLIYTNDNRTVESDSLFRYTGR